MDFSSKTTFNVLNSNRGTFNLPSPYVWGAPPTFGAHKAMAKPSHAPPSRRRAGRERLCGILRSSALRDIFMIWALLAGGAVRQPPHCANKWLSKPPWPSSALARPCERCRTRSLGGFSTSGLASRPPHPMRLENDSTVDAAVHAARIFAAAVEQHAPARAADEC